MPKPLSEEDISRMSRRNPNKKPPTAAEVKNFPNLWRNNLLGCDGLGMPRGIELPQGVHTSTAYDGVLVRRKDAEALVVKFLVANYGFGGIQTSFIYSSDKTLDLQDKRIVYDPYDKSSHDEETIKVINALCDNKNYYFSARQVAKNWFYVSVAE
ncbi:hypothetical protein NUACC21_20550 [Scytonema sp. NUACC21]